MDTLDNTDALSYIGKQHDMFGLTSENTERIKRQNSKKISVVIGNPPYNANQLNENENNKNREYPFIDKRIKETFIKYSTAQKTKVYDMYARFYRWAMDRVETNGILAMITNRSFIDSRTFDGFRKCVQSDFSHCYIIDTKSDVRANPKIAGTTHNVFGIQTGVAIMFLIRKEKQEGNCHIEYASMDDFWRKEEKLDWLKNNAIENIHFENIHPDKNNNWINLSADNDWEDLIQVANKDTKLNRSKKAIFELYTLGTISNRDDWVYDFNITELKRKIIFFIKEYHELLDKKTRIEEIEPEIKFTRNLKRDYHNYKKLEIRNMEFRQCLYRVFCKKHLYYAEELNEMRYQTPSIFPSSDSNNKLIALNQGTKDFNILSSKYLVDLHFNGDSQCLPLYRYDKEGNQLENLTDWGLAQFVNHYSDEKITKEDIFNYTYGVLHNPAYRKKYELNLKREFPRLPFYQDFWKWAVWGKALMELHLNYETVEPYNLEVVTTETKAEAKRQKKIFADVEEPEAMFARQPKIKAKLKADKAAGIIEIDELTFMKGVPKSAWEYKLGNRSAIEWVLDQYKEKKPKDPTIAEKFNTYRFADYKDQVIDLIKRVCTVSVETMKVLNEMEEEV